jgi:hypothetical protein
MNQFDYKLKLEHIKKQKSGAKLEEVIRELNADYLELHNNRYATSLKDEHIEDYKIYYKLLRYSLRLYKSKKLKKEIPYYIHSNIHKLHNYFVGKIKTDKFTYEEILDTFQYTDSIKFDSVYPVAFKNIAKIVGSNTLPVPYTLNIILDSTFNTILNYTECIQGSAKKHNNKFLAEILTIESIKYDLFADSTYTIVENYLTKLYGTFNTQEKHENSRIELNNFKVLRDRLNILTDIIEPKCTIPR